MSTAGKTGSPTHLQEDCQQNDEDSDHHQHGHHEEGKRVGGLTLQADSPAL